MEAAARAIEAEPCLVAVEVDVEGEVGLLEVNGGALAPDVALQATTAFLTCSAV